MSDNTLIALITLVGSVLGALIGAAISVNAQGSSRQPIFWILVGAITGGILTISGLAILGFFPLGSLIKAEEYDNFNDSVYDGRFNPTLWTANFSPPNSIKQHNGLIILSNEPSAITDVTSLFAKQELKMDKGFYVESRMLLSSEITGEYAEYGVGVTTNLSSGQTVRYGCVISRSSPMQLWCEVWARTKEAEYKTKKLIAGFDTWYIIRIEVTSDTTITFIVDGEKLGSYRPTDADKFAGSSNTFSLEIWSPSKDGIVSKFDNVKIGNFR
jgi:hypothetical protein